MNTSRNTQLPDEAKEEAEQYAGLMVWVNQNPKGEEQLFYEYIAATSWHAGYIACSTKLHQAQQEIEILKRWKAEALAILSPLMDYADEQFKLELGQSKTELILKRCHDYEAARALLEKFISRHEAGLLPDMFIYNEIKQYLDGKR